MKRFLEISSIIVLFLLSNNLVAQTNRVKALKPGDNCPDLVAGNVINYPAKSLKLSDFNGKLIILDFWNIWCTACIEEIPLLDSLQRKLQNSIQIILVTSNTEAEVKKLMTHSKNLAQTTLPIVVSDAILNATFPPAMPHSVWINSNKKVVAITDSYNITESHIRSVLNSSDVSFNYLSGTNNRGKKIAPMFLMANSEFADHLQEYSYFTSNMRYFTTSGGPTIDSATGKMYRLELFNRDIVDLFKIAYGGFFDSENLFGVKANRSRIKIKCADSLRFIRPRNMDLLDKWFNEHTYCYEIMVRPANEDQLQAMMCQDIERFFKISASVEKVNTKCLVLIKTGDTKELLSKGVPKMTATSESGEIAFRDKPIRDVANEIEYWFHFKIPVKDETGIVDYIDLNLQTPLLGDLASTREELRKHGLDLVEIYADIDMLVLRDKNE